MSDFDILELDYAQSEFHCCGLERSRDWENIPESCKCDEDSIDLCVDASRHISNLNNLFNTRPKRSYAKVTIKIFVSRISKLQSCSKILSIGLSIALLCQMNKKVDTPNVVYSPEAEAGNYSSLTEALEDG
ncbi:hypothetical protein CRENBAI_014300 [Crenichthys baileyi]|uniref:Uncharacterized protein n=1 Tax=Crenichthys baileyi TaxID=28760 RepID=A0AAV9SID5_9TELE